MVNLFISISDQRGCCPLLLLNSAFGSVLFQESYLSNKCPVDEQSIWTMSWHYRRAIAVILAVRPGNNPSAH